MEPYHLGNWATAIMSGAATVLCPPPTDEFDKLIHGKPKPGRGHLEPPLPQQPLIQHFHHYSNNQTSSTSFDSSLSAQSPSARTSSSENESVQNSNSKSKGSYSKVPPTPLRQIPPREYKAIGLQRFLDWSQKYFEDDAFDIFDILYQNGVTLALFLDAMKDRETEEQLLDLLVKECYFTRGFSLQLTKACRTWGESLREEE
jgi:hypothetical protein